MPSSTRQNTEIIHIGTCSSACYGFEKSFAGVTQTPRLILGAAAPKAPCRILGGCRPQTPRLILEGCRPQSLRPILGSYQPPNTLPYPGEWSAVTRLDNPARISVFVFCSSAWHVGEAFGQLTKTPPYPHQARPRAPPSTGPIKAADKRETRIPVYPTWNSILADFQLQKTFSKRTPGWNTRVPHLSAELKGPGKLSRIQPEFVDLGPKWAPKPDEAKPKMPGTVPRKQHRSIPIDFGPVSGCFYHDPNLLNCDSSAETCISTLTDSQLP
jgi:hypothetical protein